MLIGALLIACLICSETVRMMSILHQRCQLSTSILEIFAAGSGVAIANPATGWGWPPPVASLVDVAFLTFGVFLGTNQVIAPWRYQTINDGQLIEPHHRLHPRGDSP